MEEKMIKVLVVKPGMKPEIQMIEDTLESLQKIVDGYIEITYPFEDDVLIICNEEGKIQGLPLNRPLYDDYGNIYDIIVGNFIIAGDGEDGNLRGLTESEIEKYTGIFKKRINPIDIVNGSGLNIEYGIIR